MVMCLHEKFDTVDFKIIVCGDNGVGKKTFLESLNSKQHPLDLSQDDNLKTIGIDFYSVKVMIRNQPYKLSVWLFSSDDRFKKLMPSYLRGANGAIIMYDITDRSSFENIAYWLKVIREERDTKTPVLLFGNKSDLSRDRQVSHDNIVEFIVDNNIECFLEGCARTADNVKNIFKLITRAMKLEDDCYSF